MSGGVFGWDYPPGVTGNEPQIAGVEICPRCEDGVLSDDGVCDECDWSEDAEEVEREATAEAKAEAMTEAREFDGPPPGWEPM